MFNFRSAANQRHESRASIYSSCVLWTGKLVPAHNGWIHAGVVVHWLNRPSPPLPPPRSSPPRSSLSLLSLPPSFRLSDLSCGSRGLICSPNVRNHTRAKASTRSHTHKRAFHPPPPPSVPSTNCGLRSDSKPELRRHICHKSLPELILMPPRINPITGFLTPWLSMGLHHKSCSDQSSTTNYQLVSQVIFFLVIGCAEDSNWFYWMCPTN